MATTVPTIEIRVRDGDEENSVQIPLSAVRGYLVDAHRLRDMWATDQPFTATAVDYLRSMARDGLITRRLPQCTVVMAFALLHEVTSDDEIGRISAALAVAGTVLDLNLTQEAPVYCAKLAEIGSFTLQ